MNTSILNPKEQVLLEAGLDVLHFESKEWLETIDFWKDEIKFFNTLLKRKESSENSNPKYQTVLKNLDNIYADLFEDLEASIVEHEKFLSKIVLSEKGFSDADYREKHHNIFLKIKKFSKNFKTFKRFVFDYEKNL